MLLCLCARRSAQSARKRVLLAAVRPLAVAMLAMMVANVLQIGLWGWLFVLLGEFEDFYPAIYHSAVNFTSLGYGDVVMKQEWKLLGPLEAANGILMMSMTAAALTAILQNVIRSQTDAIVAGGIEFAIPGTDLPARLRGLRAPRAATEPARMSSTP